MGAALVLGYTKETSPPGQGSEGHLPEFSKLLATSLTLGKLTDGPRLSGMLQ